MLAAGGNVAYREEKSISSMGFEALVRPVQFDTRYPGSTERRLTFLPLLNPVSKSGLDRGRGVGGHPGGRTDLDSLLIPAPALARPLDLFHYPAEAPDHDPTAATFMTVALLPLLLLYSQRQEVGDLSIWMDPLVACPVRFALVWQMGNGVRDQTTELSIAVLAECIPKLKEDLSSDDRRSTNVPRV